VLILKIIEFLTKTSCFTLKISKNIILIFFPKFFSKIMEFFDLNQLLHRENFQKHDIFPQNIIHTCLKFKMNRFYKKIRLQKI